MTEAVQTQPRRLNPMVERYVTTDFPLQVILAGMRKPRPQIVQSLLYLIECLNGQRLARDAISAAQGVPLENEDPEFSILLLCTWAELSCQIGRPSEAQTLIHRAKSVVVPETHPEIRARVMHVESIQADTMGDKGKHERIMREILELLPAHSPRRRFYLWELGIFLAQQARGTDNVDIIRELSWQTNERFPISRVLTIQFVNAVETGDLQSAQHLVPRIAASFADINEDYGKVRLSDYQRLLTLMRSQGPSAPLHTARPQVDAGVPAWLQVVQYLLCGDTDQALSLARVEAEKVLGAIFGNGFKCMNLIRSELAAGRWEGAKRLLSMRATRGNTHYLDDFFLARAERLAGNRRAASTHFAAALAAVEHFHARGRLDFELRLSCEMSYGDVVQLTRAAEKSGRITTVPKDPAASSETPAPEPVFRGVNAILGRSAAIQKVRDMIAQFADNEAPVHITGETGTGKELAALALHESSHRLKEPFIPVNCGAITDTLLESELFGHERGAFTGADRTTRGLFEEAGKGTIFLDEIGDISPRLQQALLRVLETNEIRAVGSSKSRKIACRIVTATNAELDERSRTGGFRRDLLFRLHRLGIIMPPLRERPEDILFLARHFMDTGRRIGDHAKISKDLENRIRTYEWPGNVRELKNVIERMRLMHSDKLSYDVHDLDLKFQSPPTVLDSVEGEERRLEPRVRERLAAARELQEAAEQPRRPASDREVDGILRKGKSTVRRIERLRDLFSKYDKLTRSDVIDVLGVSPNTATKYLKDLCDDGYIERIEPSASTRSHYFIPKSTA